MKIAFLSTFYPFRGGIAQFNASIYRALEQEHDVRAFTFTRQYPELLFPGETQMVTESDTVDKISSTQVLDTINPLSYFKTATAINAWEPDLLVMKYWMSFFGPSLGTVARRMKPRTKVITVLDNVIPHEKRIIDRPFTSYFLNQNDGFVAMSDAVRDDLLSLNPRSKKVIRLEHPVYDHFGSKPTRDEAHEQLKLDKDKKTILFFGFIRKYKGLDLLIEAFDGLDESYQLVIAGECYGSFDEYAARIERAQFKKNIHTFNTYITDEQVPLFFAAADTCVLPYRSATQSGITSIALHFEVPIIATDTGGLKEIVKHDETGLIVNEVKPEAIRDMIQTFFKTGRRAAFVEGIKALKDEMSWENFGKKIIAFYRQL